jgi:glutamate-1-semialdehyde 2,1-aminomutase
MYLFEKSEEQLARAQKTIPLGSQTFSKSRTQFPVGVSPLYMKRGKGCRLWDVDGNEYIDMISSLASITLGYCDPDIDAAVAQQLQDGVILSLPHTLESEVAELICEFVPCAEMVRFGKNGSDATSGAVRLARAFTQRSHVAVCGYHGWQDWYIGSTARHRGVPDETRELTHAFGYNNLASLEALFEAHPNQIAAIVLEPMNVEYPAPGFLEGVREIATREGAVLVFDETITGFRYAKGGAQELFGVTPDLATFGKGLANGYPLSAVVGRRDIMMLMEEIFFSFTFGGELLSLAAAKATMEKMKREPVLETINAVGTVIIERLQQKITEHNLQHVFSVKGHPSWSFLVIADAEKATSFELKTLLMQEFHQLGILTFGTHNVNYCHGNEEVETLMRAYDTYFSLVSKCLAGSGVAEALRCQALKPLFVVR